MADVTKVKLPDNTTLNVKDPLALQSIYNDVGDPHLKAYKRDGNTVVEALKSHIEKVFHTEEQELVVNNKTYFICSQEVSVDDSGTVVDAKILPSSKRYFISAAFGSVTIAPTNTYAFANGAGTNIAAKLEVLNGSYKCEFVMTSTGKLCQVKGSGASLIIQCLYGTLNSGDFSSNGTFIVEVLNDRDYFTSNLSLMNCLWYTSYPEAKRNLVVGDFDTTIDSTLTRAFMTSAYSVDQTVDVSAVSMQYLNSSGNWVAAPGTFTRKVFESSSSPVTTGRRYSYIYTPAGTITTNSIVKVTLTFSGTAPATQEYYTILHTL